MLAEDGGHFDEFSTKPITQYISGKSWVNNHAHVLQSKKHFDNKFVYYTLVHKDIRKYINGSSRAKLNQEDLWTISINVPEIKEQQKLKDFMSLIDQKIQKQEQLVKLLKKYKKGVIEDIFSRKYSFGNDEWRESRLGEICSYRRGSFPQPYGLPEWYDDVNGMPFIQVADVDDNFKIKDITKRKISKNAEKQSVYVPRGSLIITLQGTIGRVAITHYDAFVDRTLLIISNISTDILPEYLMYACYLKFNYEKQTADGSIIKTITKETLTNFIISYPSLKMQKKIVDYLMKIENYLLHETQIYDNLLQQKRGLLQQLFI